MKEMKTFSEIDKHEGRCAENEVGQPWEDRWGIPDLQAGLCIPLALGKRKMPSDFTGISDSAGTDDEVEAELPPPVDLTGLPAEFVYERELFDYHRDRAAYRARGGKVDVLMRMGEEYRKTQIARGAQLAHVTATKLNAMNAFERTIKIVEAVMLEPEDVQRRILERWGVSKDDLQEVLAEIREEIA
jgi:hypothetical protein